MDDPKAKLAAFDRAGLLGRVQEKPPEVKCDRCRPAIGGCFGDIGLHIRGFNSTILHCNKRGYANAP
jgi:hypothetical protein